ncbi:MAG: GNAT family N-acetyltransferase [Flavobacteriaceae bacterium]|nr:MAG: GNAT family N-acetyltransferase [Flavobacteriaceae bacterium]
MIRHAKILEMPDILSLSKACAAHMISKEIYQWNAHYPSKKIFEKDIEREELYVLEFDNEIVGMIVISTLMDETYLPIVWLTPNQNNNYIHRLAIHPKFQGKGYAQQLMDFAENYTKEKGITSIRLDTFSQNKRNQRFYEARGYQKLGDVFIPNQSEHPFHCYELIL